MLKQPSPPVVLILCGYPFSGKTTFARALAEKTGWARIDLDEINTARGLGRDNQAITPEEWTGSYDESYRQMETALEKGTSVIYDQVSHLRSMRDMLRDIAVVNGARPIVVHFDVPAEVCTSRWRANRLSGARYDVRDEDFMNVVDNFEPPGPDENAIVVHETISIDDWIREVLRPATMQLGKQR